MAEGTLAGRSCSRVLPFSAEMAELPTGTFVSFSSTDILRSPLVMTDLEGQRATSTSTLPRLPAPRENQLRQTRACIEGGNARLRFVSADTFVLLIGDDTSEEEPR